MWRNTLWFTIFSTVLLLIAGVYSFISWHWSYWGLFDIFCFGSLLIMAWHQVWFEYKTRPPHDRISTKTPQRRKENSD
jgi:hypothetical protein